MPTAIAPGAVLPCVAVFHHGIAELAVAQLSAFYNLPISGPGGECKPSSAQSVLHRVLGYGAQSSSDSVMSSLLARLPFVS